MADPPSKQPVPRGTEATGTGAFPIRRGRTTRASSRCASPIWCFAGWPRICSRPRKRRSTPAGRASCPASATASKDILHNGGRPRQVDASPFRLGENMAATPRTVVYRNDVMELLQYMPQTDEVHATPLLAVQHRRTVFTISYRNPDSSLSGVTMEDYLVFGTQAALDVVTGSPAPTPSTSSLSVWAERSPR